MDLTPVILQIWPLTVLDIEFIIIGFLILYILCNQFYLIGYKKAMKYCTDQLKNDIR